ncbi:MAG: hypothetical protein WBD40_06320 [Tepidisphaeraceae bacterium]
MLLDTSSLYCYLDAADARHAQAVSLLDSATLRLAHYYVLAELAALCNARGVERRVMLEFVEELTNDPAVTVHWVGPELHRQAIELLRQRPDKAYSLCDAISFLLMRERGVAEALTTDHHFQQEGFVKLLPS